MTADSVPAPPADQVRPRPADPAGRPDPAGPAAAGHRGWSPLRVAALLTVAALVLVLVRLVVVQSFVIPSTSMEPGLQVGDRVLVLRLGQVRRGDVVVFDGAGAFTSEPVAPASGLARIGRAVASAVGVPVGERDFVKRVIGLPGDRVVCCDGGRLTVDGQPLNEPYLQPGDAASDLRFDVRVPPGRIWVMGDHRSVSGDSRSHLGDPGGGFVPLDQVVGRVVSVWWPLSRATGVGRVDPLAARAAP